MNLSRLNQAEHRSGTTFGNIMIQRYWRDTRWLKNPTAGGGLERYQAVIAAFRTSAAEFDLDLLLVLSQGYQESGVDQSRRSHAGAVGVMQIKPSTAAGPPISITRRRSSEPRPADFRTPATRTQRGCCCPTRPGLRRRSSSWRR